MWLLFPGVPRVLVHVRMTIPFGRLALITAGRWADSQASPVATEQSCVLSQLLGTMKARFGRVWFAMSVARSVKGPLVLMMQVAEVGQGSWRRA